MTDNVSSQGRIWPAPRPIDVMLICGVKSASTWLAQRLGSLESICYVRGQDLVFDFADSRLVGFRQPVQPRDGQLVVSRRNLSAAVLKNPYAEAFRRHNPNMKFVSLLREPVSRTLSNIRHTTSKYPIHQWPETFKKAAKRQGFGRVVIDTDALLAQELGNQRDERSLGGSSFYSECLNPFLERFPKAQFLVLPLEPQMKDLTSHLSRVCEFLGLMPDSYEFHSSAAAKVNVSQAADIGILQTLKGFRKVEVSSPSAACLDALRAAFLKDARQLDAEFGTRAVDLWQLDRAGTQAADAPLGPSGGMESSSTSSGTR